MLKLERRKNWQRGSVVRRKCWCHTCPQTCPVHTVWKFLQAYDEGAQPYAAITYKDALWRLRGSMSILGVKNASTYGTQDLRRGHTQDLKLAGAPDDTIRSAGQWRARRGPLPYMDIPGNENELVAKAHDNMQDTLALCIVAALPAFCLACSVHLAGHCARSARRTRPRRGSGRGAHRHDG